MFSQQLLSNKTALVTGASRGIGQAIAIALAQVGANVIGTATTQEGANKITAYFQQAKLAGEGMVLNVSDANSTEKFLTELKSKGMIHILVNNAAVTRDNLLLRMKDEEWEEVINTDLNAVFRLSRACVRDMLKNRWGRIIIIGSVVGAIGNPGQTNYCAAKAGVVGFSKALALEVGSRNITVNTVAPGFIETDMTNQLNQEQRDTIFSRIPAQ